MNKQTQNIINVSLTLIAIYLYSFTANNIEDNALALPVVSNIQTPIAKNDIADPVHDKV